MDSILSQLYPFHMYFTAPRLILISASYKFSLVSGHFFRFPHKMSFYSFLSLSKLHVHPTVTPLISLQFTSTLPGQTYSRGAASNSGAVWTPYKKLLINWHPGQLSYPCVHQGPIKGYAAVMGTTFWSQEQICSEKFSHHPPTSYNRQFFDQTDGIIVVSPHAPAIVRFSMEHAEQQVLSTASEKPAYWYRYVMIFL